MQPTIMVMGCASPDGAGVIEVSDLVDIISPHAASHTMSSGEQLCVLDDHLGAVLVTVVLGTFLWITIKEEDVHGYIVAGDLPMSRIRDKKSLPFAVCTKNVGRKNKAKYERCVMKVKATVNEAKKKTRCWKGYRPTPGKTPYSPGSCMKEEFYNRFGSLLTEKMKGKKASKKFQTQSKWNVAPAMRDASPSDTGKAAASNKLPATSIENRQDEEKKGVMPKMKMGVHKSRAGGLTKAGVAAYRRANPGSKLKTAVTTKPSKLKKGSKSAKRRKSFCARMGGMKKRLTSAKTASDPNSRINKALRKWNC